MQKVATLIIKDILAISRDIDTSVLVLSDERIAHIVERHPGDFEIYGAYITEVAEHPDFILQDDKHVNTGIYVKHIKEEATSLRLTVRFHVKGDEPGFFNSVLSFQHIRDQEYRRLRKKSALIIYIAEGK